MHEARAVSEHDRTAQHQGCGELPVLQAVDAPCPLAVGTAPCVHEAVGLGAVDVLLVAVDAAVAAGGLAPEQLTPRRVDAAHGRLERAGAQHAVELVHMADEVDQAFDVVGAARCGDGGLPAQAAVVGVEARQAAGQPDHQRVARRHQHTGLAQHQRLAGTRLVPQPATGRAVVGGDRTVGRQHEHPATRDQRRRESLGGELAAPQLLARRQRDDFVAGGDDGRQRAVAAHAGRQRRACAGAPQLAAGPRIQSRHTAVAARKGDGGAVHVGHQGKADGADLGGPGLPNPDHRDVGTELLRLGLLAAEPAADGRADAREHRATGQRCYQNNS